MTAPNGLADLTEARNGFPRRELEAFRRPLSRHLES